MKIQVHLEKPTFKLTLSMPTLTFQFPSVLLSREFIKKEVK